jgi:hypothetical protein
VKRLLAIAVLVATAAFSLAGTASASSTANWQLANGSVKASPGLATFNFTATNKARLLYSNKQGGNILGTTMSASYTISGLSGPAVFTYAGENTPSNPCGTPATVRLFFQTSGKFAYTNYWWADVTPGSAVLASGSSQPLSALVDPTLTAWSDWNGQPSSANVDAFNAAAANATVVGLSYGGGCFFENGVGTSDGSGSFTLDGFTN